jgi:hypothetical protein
MNIRCYISLSWLLVLLCCNAGIKAQNTIGTLFYNAEKSLGGYHLIYPNRQSTVYLMDECGQIVHRWEDEDQVARPGAVAYLLPNGNLLRAKNYAPLFNGPSFSAGGSGGVVQLLSWDNDVLWTYVVADSIQRQHHDVHPMPNGNVLILAYENHLLEDLVANGFDTVSYLQRSLWSEKILEIDPVTDSIVWEWRLWDHLVQEYDSEALNYRRVAAHPERVNINYQEFSESRSDWAHANALDYNEALDQIMISARNFNEIWIIDHSTTTEEAADSLGGISGEGGDLLWRWGSPHAYNQGTFEEQQLFWNHDAQWIDDFVDTDYPHYGAVAVFNNFINYEVENGRSRGQIITPVYDELSHHYVIQDSTFLPLGFSATFNHPDPAQNFSSSGSSIQLMGNGHVIMCAALQGRSFELDETGELVWEYLTPLFNGMQFTQGFQLETADNVTFQVERYPREYAAFIGRDLSPQGYLELEPNEEFCNVVAIDELKEEESSLMIFPNPSTGQFTVNIEMGAIGQILTVRDARGVLVLQQLLRANSTELDMSDYPAGMYLLQISGKSDVKKLILK